MNGCRLDYFGDIGREIKYYRTSTSYSISFTGKDYGIKMKKKAFNKIVVLVTALVLVFTLAMSAYAETIEDRLTAEFDKLIEQYNSSSDVNLKETISSLLEQYGINGDLSSLTDTDIGKIIKDFGNNLALDDLLNLAEEAFASGSDMIKDVISGGSGTSDGKNTATTTTTTASATLPSIVAGTNSGATTAAAGITQSAVTTTSETVTYDIGSTTSAGIVGAGVTTAEATTGAVVEEENSGMGMSSLAVLLVLSFSTIAVIVAIVVFFVLKRK